MLNDDPIPLIFAGLPLIIRLDPAWLSLRCSLCCSYVEETDIRPFTFDEMTLFLKGVRKDFYNYYFVRRLTGMRTGEIDGLG